MLRVMVDPGHGGLEIGDNNFSKYGGCFYRRGRDEVIYEKDIVLQQAKLLNAWNTSYTDNVKFEFTRTTDDYISLEKRCELADEAGVDLFISLHVNWWKTKLAEGTTVFYHETSEGGKDVASNISGELDSWPEVKNRHMKPTDSEIDKDHTPYMYVLDQTSMPAVLLESGFLSNPNDRNVLLRRSGLFRLTECVIEGISDLSPRL